MDVPLHHPDFGKALPCECQQQEVTTERLARFRRYSNLGYMTRFTFDNLDPDGRSQDEEGRLRFRHVSEAASAYAQDPRGWFVLVGPSSSGKTHLAAAIANHVLERGHLPLFVTAPDLLDHLRATFAPTAEFSYDELFEQVRNTALLVLDELGAHASTSWAHEKLSQLLSHRASAQLPTVVTLRGRLEDLDEHLRSRLSDPALAQVHHLGTTTRLPLLQHLGDLPETQLQRQTFDRFDVRGNNPDEAGRQSLETALYTARSFADAPDGWLVFAGPVGCGKTHLAVAIVNRCLELGHPVFFATVPKLLDHLRETFSPNVDSTYQSRFDEVRNALLLVLDDLGAQSSTHWADEKLYQLIAHRHNARLPTVITTNRLAFGQGGESSSPNREHLSEPISSRLKDISLVEPIIITAPDYRDRARPSTAARSRPRPSPRR